MYLAYNPQLSGGRLQWPQTAVMAAKAGFAGVDVRITPAMEDGLDNTRKLLSENNLRPAATGLPVVFQKDDDAFERDLERLAEAASFATAIGCPRMATHVPASAERPKAEQRRLMLARLGASAEVLARFQVQLGLEFLGPLHFRQAQPFEFVWRMDEMLALAKECGPNCGLLLDAWHWHHAGATLDDILAAGKERIVTVHFNDAADQAPEEVLDTERQLPGEGVIDLHGFLRALKTIGYEGALSVEVSSRALRAMPVDEAAKLGLAAASRAMREAGILAA